MKADTALPFVRFHGVSKRFGDGPVVLEQMDFIAQRGDFITLIGPSGCGKSTLLRLIAGLTSVSSGAIDIDGVPPEQAGGELAFVFQDATLLPWLTAAQNVALPLRLRGIGREERVARAQAALDLVRLGDRARYHPRQLSGGQRMRVSLARALALDPTLLLLDEPFGALDEMTRNHLNEELLAIRERQAWTAFFVTHSVAEAVFLSNRILVLGANPGRIHREIPVDLAYPRTNHTRESLEYQQLVARVSRLLRSVEAPEDQPVSA